MKQDIGIIGLGAMGKGMASSLRRAGYQVHVCDVPPEAAQAFASRPRPRGRVARSVVPGRCVLIEPINTRDIPGFYLNRQDRAHALVQEIAAPNFKVQFDLYHCQIVEGDVATKIRNDLPTGRVGHFQIAGVPERHEPSVGELNYGYLFAVIDEVSQACAWEGWNDGRPRRFEAPFSRPRHHKTHRHPRCHRRWPRHPRCQRHRNPGCRR